jgi:hypothetical protein
MNPNDGFTASFLTCIMFDPYCSNPRMDVLCDSWVCLDCHIANREDNQQTREAGQSIPDMLIAIGETHVQIPAL